MDTEVKCFKIFERSPATTYFLSNKTGALLNFLHFSE